MLTGHSLSQQHNNVCKGNLSIPGAVIAECLGSGLAYSEWRAVVEKRGYVWSTKLKKAIIEKEWDYFRPEIQRLRVEPKINHSASSKSNSLVSIWKRLKGETWSEGWPDEREERLRTRMLLGKDAKIRCLQNYVHDWDQQDTLFKSRTSTNNPPIKSALSTAPEKSPLTDSSVGALPMESSGDEPDPDFPLQSFRTDADTLPSMVDGPPQFGFSPAPVSTPTGTYSSAANGFDSLRSPPPFFSREKITSSFGHDPISEDDVPTTTNYNQSFHADPEHDVFDWLETHQVSEISGSLESPASGPESEFQGTFLDHPNSIDWTVPLELDCLDELTTKDTRSDFAGEHNFNHRLQAGPSQSISPPRSNSKSLKRRRRSTPELTMTTQAYRPDPISTLSHVTGDGDIMMSGYESIPQRANKPVTLQSWPQLPPQSEPLPIPPSSGMISKTAFEIRAQIELESELQCTKNELEFVKRQHETEIAFLRKQHQKEVESSSRIRNAMEVAISELHVKVREIQKSTEHYEKLARSAISHNIVLQESISRKKSITERLSTNSIDEREHSTKQVQFPSSKNPRPLSLTCALRPATARKTSVSPPQRPSHSNPDDASSLQLPMTTNSSSRPVTPDSGQLFSGTSASSNVSPKSTGQRCRPDYSDKNQTGRDNGSGLPDNTAASNLSTSSRRGFLQQSMHKLSNQFLRKQYREDSTKAATTVPVLPPFEASVPLDRQMAGVLVDGDKRLTNDSGYDSLRSESGSHLFGADTQ